MLIESHVFTASSYPHHAEFISKGLHLGIKCESTDTHRASKTWHGRNAWTDDTKAQQSQPDQQSLLLNRSSRRTRDTRSNVVIAQQGTKHLQETLQQTGTVQLPSSCSKVADGLLWGCLGSRRVMIKPPPARPRSSSRSLFPRAFMCCFAVGLCAKDASHQRCAPVRGTFVRQPRAMAPSPRSHPRL